MLLIFSHNYFYLELFDVLDSDDDFAAEEKKRKSSRRNDRYGSGRRGCEYY